jgi:hypothetical protein
MEQNPRKFCRKCLLEDIAADEFLDNMRTYLEGLDEAVKAEDKVYKERLSACRSCEKLNEGICKLCGCFVEYRAAMKNKACPDLIPKW